MKDAIDSIPAEPSLDQDSFANRKLIRPSLSRVDHNHAPVSTGERRDRPERPERLHNDRPHNDRPDRGDRNERGERGDRGGDRAMGGGRKPVPAEQTNAENFYYQKQMQSRTPMVVVLRDGEEIHGVIEWYDKCSIKITRNGAPNLMVYKPAIKYMYKEGEKG